MKRKIDKHRGAKSKRTGLLLLVLLLASALLCPLSAKAEEQSSTKKIISVVYDDSGSMKNDGITSWASANYAMQAFAALLNEQDQMYITYMSDIMNGKKEAVEIDLINTEAAVKQIREDDRAFDETPVEAVDVAMEKLLSVQNEDENTQFWLIILTDGVMLQYDSNHVDIQDAVDDYAGTEMCNGSTVYITYMGIGNAAMISGDPSDGVNVVSAGNNIVPALSDIANKVSGRMVFEESQIGQKDGKTITVHSEIPLYAVSVFSQGSNTKVEQASAEKKLDVKRNVELKYPEPKYGAVTDTSLFGNAALITNGDKVIQPGDYEIVFSEDVALENTVIMYQPAIKMAAEMKRNGVKVDNPEDLALGDVVDIELIPTNPETGEVIEDSKLPAGILWTVSYQVDDQTVDESDGRILTGVAVQEGSNKIVGTMQIPNYAPNRQTIDFIPARNINYGITVNQPDQVTFARGKLGLDGAEGDVVTFQITDDGVPMSKEELNGVSLKIVDTEVDDSGVKGFLNRFGMKTASPGIKQNDDGTFTLYPKFSVIPAFLIKAGTYTVTVAVDADTSVQAVGTFEIVPSLTDWADLVPVIIGLLILLYLIYILFFKAKFDGQTLKIQVYVAAGPMGGGKLLTTEGDEVVLKKFGGDLFAPKNACTRSVSGIRVIADGSGGAYIKKRTVASYEAYGNAGANPLHNFSGVVGSLKQVKGKEDLIPDMVSLGSLPFYLKQGKRLYRITLE